MTSQHTHPASTDSIDSKLDELKRRYPRWRIWRGHATGDVWALPPRGHSQQLISAADADELEAKVAEIAAWENEQAGPFALMAR